jgi:tetratricopeptide (TPR) repeat protein
LDKGCNDEVLRRLKELVSRCPTIVEAHLLLGKTYMQRDQLDEAERWLAKASEYKEHCPEAWYQLGKVKLRRGRKEQALRFFERFVETSKHDPAAWNQVGVDLFMNGEVKEAEWFLEQALCVNKSFADAHFNLGVLYFSTERFDEAKEAFCRTEQMESAIPEAYNYLGLLAFRDRDYARAEAYYQKASQLLPDMADILFNLGRLYMQMDRTDEAIAQLRACLSKDGGNADAYNCLGLCLLEKGATSGAVKAFQRSLQLFPGQERIKNILERLEETGTMKPCKPSQGESLWEVAESHFVGGEYRKALPLYEEILGANPANMEALMRLSMCYLYLEAFDAAIVGFRKILELRPGNEDAQLYLSAAVSGKSLSSSHKA